MAGEGVAQVVKAQGWPAFAIQLRAFYGLLQSTPTDVALRLGGAARCTKDPVGRGREWCGSLVREQQVPKLFDQRISR